MSAARPDPHWQRQDHAPSSSALHPYGSSRASRPAGHDASGGTAELQSSTLESVEAPLNTPAAVVPTLSSVAYFTPAQLEQLYSRERGSKMSAAKWQTNRVLATGFIQATASRLGFPQRTIATAQQIYQRFHLFYPPSEFVLHELAVTSLFVAAKLNDTPKKAREILLASYALRFPQLVKGAMSDTDQTTTSNAGANEDYTFPTLAGQKRKTAPTAPISDLHSHETDEKEGDLLRMTSIAIGNVSEGDIDPSILETDRKRLMALEKLVLKSLCFNFHLKSNVALKMVIKLGRVNDLPKIFLRTAWIVTADMHRTAAPLQYPPNVIAMASLYTAALLVKPPKQASGQSDDSDPISLFVAKLQQASASLLSQDSSRMLHTLEKTCQVHIEDVEEAMHELLDLYLTCVSQLPPSLYMQNPGGTATPSPHSPADPLDMVTSSPSSSTGLSDSSLQQNATARRKLKQYEYAPPPFAVVDWLNTRRSSHLHLKEATNPAAASSTATNPAPSLASDPTMPAKELSALLTDLKIYLRGVEYSRQKADDATLASLGIAALTKPTAASASSSVQTAGETPAAASVEICLTVAHLASAVEPKPFDTSTLTSDERNVIERITRRKLAISLRTVFIEPGVVLRGNAQDDAVDETLDQGQNGSAGPGSTQKRMRIDYATRYIF